MNTADDAFHDIEQKREELAAVIDRFCAQDGIHSTAIPSLSLVRKSHPTSPVHTLHEPSLCIVVQGKKVKMLAGESYVYGPSDYFVVSVDLPISGAVIEASPEEPYLCLRMEIDPQEVLDLIRTTDVPSKQAGATRRGLFVSKTSYPLLDAAVRLVRLLETSRDIPVLAPLFTREILYRILLENQGESLRQIAIAGSNSYRIADVIRKIKQDYAEPLRIEELAALAHMSPSSLHRHFKDVTAMSPLQYQKRVRLQEARRLLLSQAIDAAEVAYRVGYDSPSQFSREYARLFGRPPITDIKQLRRNLLAANT
ncbi:AraC family transcriptional regulator [Alicyclobacillus cycloheptanicus]|uniref:AraC-like DNA-binding protein n=1 Tax=Alicyclobacillus cycloheptanicus TaxID=1457 RepID=A0ABT9XN27_9BACL|nr:AraC family transcriptional regulator [Alicyclobacillus cycloheptanicus]MDQ0191434.1 AraC-like DNA-binding protein [Alicyclobacillus cycloheptanicus]